MANFGFDLLQQQAAMQLAQLQQMNPQQAGQAQQMLQTLYRQQQQQQPQQQQSQLQARQLLQQQQQQQQQHQQQSHQQFRQQAELVQLRKKLVETQLALQAEEEHEKCNIQYKEKAMEQKRSQENFKRVLEQQDLECKQSVEQLQRREEQLATYVAGLEAEKAKVKEATKRLAVLKGHLDAVHAKGPRFYPLRAYQQSPPMPHPRTQRHLTSAQARHFLHPDLQPNVQEVVRSWVDATAPPTIPLCCPLYAHADTNPVTTPNPPGIPETTETVVKVVLLEHKATSADVHPYEGYTVWGQVHRKAFDLYTAGVKEGETPEEAARRVLQDEAGVTFPRDTRFPELFRCRSDCGGGGGGGGGRETRFVIPTASSSPSTSAASSQPPLLLRALSVEVQETTTVVVRTAKKAKKTRAAKESEAKEGEEEEKEEGEKEEEEEEEEEVMVEEEQQETRVRKIGTWEPEGKRLRDLRHGVVVSPEAALCGSVLKDMLKLKYGKELLDVLRALPPAPHALLVPPLIPQPNIALDIFAQANNRKRKREEEAAAAAAAAAAKREADTAAKDAADKECQPQKKAARAGGEGGKGESEEGPTSVTVADTEEEADPTTPHPMVEEPGLSFGAACAARVEHVTEVQEEVDCEGMRPFLFMDRGAPDGSLSGVIGLDDVMDLLLGAAPEQITYGELLELAARAGVSESRLFCGYKKVLTKETSKTSTTLVGERSQQVELF